MHEDIENTKEEVEHRARDAFATIMKGLSAAASIGAAIRYFEPGRYFAAARMLRWMGLRRGRSVLGTIGLLGAGAIAGAGIAMFVSPRSGRDTRQTVARGFKNIGRRGKELVETATHQLGSMGEGNGGQESRRGGQEGKHGGQEGKHGGQEGKQTSPATGSPQMTGSSAGESGSRSGSMGVGSENRRPG